jgi:Putative transposase
MGMDSQTKTTQIRTSPVVKLLWLILQHVLPKGLRRVRDYGLLRDTYPYLLCAVHNYLIAFSIHGPIRSDAFRIIEK